MDLPDSLVQGLVVVVGLPGQTVGSLRLVRLLVRLTLVRLTLIRLLVRRLVRPLVRFLVRLLGVQLRADGTGAADSGLRGLRPHGYEQAGGGVQGAGSVLPEGQS